jgi:hypothetical protein
MVGGKTRICADERSATPELHGSSQLAAATRSGGRSWDRGAASGQEAGGEADGGEDEHS